MSEKEPKEDFNFSYVQILKESLVCAKLMRFSGPAARLVHFLFAIFVVSSFLRWPDKSVQRQIREIANNVITEMMRSKSVEFLS